MKKSKNRFLVATGIALGIAISAVGVGLGWYFGIEKPKEQSTTSQPAPAPSSSNSGANVASENGIKANVKTLLSANGVTSYVVNYTITPASYTGKVKTKIEWFDTNVTDNMADYLTLVHDETDKSVTITLVKAFSHQAKVTIYSEDDPNVNAVVTIDYANRVETTAHNVNITKQTASSEILDTSISEIGTLTYGDSLSSVSFNFSNTFISNLENSLGYTVSGWGVGSISTTIPLNTASATISEKKVNLDVSSLNGDFFRSITFAWAGGAMEPPGQAQLRDCPKNILESVLASPIIEAKTIVNYTGCSIANSGEKKSEISVAASYVELPISGITAGVSNYVF